MLTPAALKSVVAPLESWVLFDSVATLYSYGIRDGSSILVKIITLGGGKGNKSSPFADPLFVKKTGNAVFDKTRDDGEHEHSNSRSSKEKDR